MKFELEVVRFDVADVVATSVEECECELCEKLDTWDVM